MKRRAFLLLLAAMGAVQAVASTALATPTPPVVLVNDSDRQCAQAIQGDDCHWCDPPEGWTVLGYASNSQCPAGYADLGYI